MSYIRIRLHFTPSSGLKKESPRHDHSCTFSRSRFQTNQKVLRFVESLTDNFLDGSSILPTSTKVDLIHFQKKVARRSARIVCFSEGIPWFFKGKGKRTVLDFWVRADFF